MGIQAGRAEERSTEYYTNENATTDIKPNETYAEPVPEKPVEAVQSVQIQQKQTTEQK